MKRQRFDAWLDLRCWALGIRADFYLNRVMIEVGPFGAQFYWGKS